MHRETIQDDARDDQTEDLSSFYNDIDLESLPKADRPEQYGKILRVALWCENGLQREVISPTRNSEVKKPAFHFKENKSFQMLSLS